MPNAAKHTCPGWVRRKAVTLRKRDQRRGGWGHALSRSGTRALCGGLPLATAEGQTSKRVALERAAEWGRTFSGWSFSVP